MVPCIPVESIADAWSIVCYFCTAVTSVLSFLLALR